MSLRQVAVIALIALLFINHSLKAQEGIFEVGLRFQKTVNLYLENGFSMEYSDKKLLPDKLYVGFSYVSSRFGAAIHSNALKQDNYLVSVTWYFRPERLVRPVVGMNAGYFVADYEYQVFQDLPNKSALFSLEGGISLDLESPLKFVTTAGYNMITGDGIGGPGTLFPLYVQISVLWDVLKN